MPVDDPPIPVGLLNCMQPKWVAREHSVIHSYILLLGFL